MNVRSQVGERKLWNDRMVEKLIKYSTVPDILDLTLFTLYSTVITTSVCLTFRGPCIVIYSYNKNQLDALFHKFILVWNSTCFGQIYCPPSGVSTLYTQQ